MALDRIDIAILEALQKDGRMPNAALAEKVGLSQSACSRRLDNLEKSGVIEGYHARLSNASIGHRMTAIVHISLSGQFEKTLADFEGGVRNLMRDVERCTEYLVILKDGQVKTEGYIRDLCAGEADRYLLRVSHDVERAVNTLKSKGIEVQNRHSREPSFEVLLRQPVKPRDLFEILITEGIQIRQLVPRNFTVEEVYRKYVDLEKELAHAV